MNYLKKFLAITLIFVMQFQSVHASVAVGSWSLGNPVVNGATTTWEAVKNGARSTVAISPSSAQVAKSLLRGGLVGLALSAVTQAILDGIDYVMDSAKQELRYTPKNATAPQLWSTVFENKYIYSTPEEAAVASCNFKNETFSSVRYIGFNVQYAFCKTADGRPDSWAVFAIYDPSYDPKSAEKTIPLTTLATQIINLAEQGNPKAKAYIASVVQDMLEHDEDYRKSLEAQLDAKLQEAQSIGSNNGNNNNGGNSNSGNNSATKPVPSTSGNSTTANPTPPNNDDEHKFKRPNENLEKGDRIDLSTFVKGRYEGQNVFIDPKTRYMIIRDRAGANSHGGSFWKLLDKTGRRVATLAEDGRVLRK